MNDSLPAELVRQALREVAKGVTKGIASVATESAMNGKVRHVDDSARLVVIREVSGQQATPTVMGVVQVACPECGSPGIIQIFTCGCQTITYNRHGTPARGCNDISHFRYFESYAKDCFGCNREGRVGDRYSRYVASGLEDQMLTREQLFFSQVKKEEAEGRGPSPDEFSERFGRIMDACTARDF